jgi:hypothetical protein
MFKTILLLLFSILLIGINSDFARAQWVNCNGNIPSQFIDYSANPDTSSIIVINLSSGLGECCNIPTNNNCNEVVVLLHPDSEGIAFDLSGATGSFTIYEAPCGGNTYQIGDIICVDGVGPHYFLTCRPGASAPYNVNLISFPTPGGSGDIETTEGCDVQLDVLGLDPSTITWSSISPGAPNEYNNYLSDLNGGNQGVSGSPYTGQESVLVTPIPGGPQSITYEVCGMPNQAGVCSNTIQEFCTTSTVTIFPDLFAEPGPPVAICNGTVSGSTVTAFAIGGTAPYTYTWTGPNGFNEINTHNNTEDNITVLEAGVYTVVISDGTGCPEATTFITVDEFFVDIIADAGPDVIVCGEPVPTINFNGTVSATNSGVWSGGNGTYAADNTDLNLQYTPSAAEIAAGTVTLTLTPTNTGGCPFETDEVTITITEFTSTVDITPTNIDCNSSGNGEVELTITTGNPPYAVTDFLWSNGETTQNISGLEPGTYDVTITDENGCFIELSAEITQPEPLILTIVGDSIDCFGSQEGVVSGTISGGTAPYTIILDETGAELTINTDGGAYQFTDLSGLPSGGFEFYNVTVTDANGNTAGCLQTAGPVEMHEPESIVVNLLVSDVLCHGDATGTITGTVTGGTNPYTIELVQTGEQIIVELDGGEFTFTDLEGVISSGSSYTINVIDANGTGVLGGCVEIIQPIIINEPEPIEVTINGDEIICFGDATGTVTGTVTGGTPPYSVILDETGEEVVLFNPGDSYEFGGLSGEPSGGFAEYSVSVTDGNGNTGGCAANAGPVSMIEPEQLIITVDAFTNETCDYNDDGTITVSASGGTGNYTYQIIQPILSATNTTGEFSGLTGEYDADGGTEYTIQVTDENNCTHNVTQVIIQPDPLEITVDAFTNETCDYNDDGTITVIANGGTGAYSYSITDPIVAGPSATGNFTGLTGDYVINGGTEYTIQVTDENGCVHETTQVITQPDELIITVDAFTNETCDYNDDGTITVIANGGTGAYSYSITDPIVAGPSATGNFTGLTGDYVINGGTEYTIQVTDENGCVHETTQVITQPDELIITVDAFTNETCDYNDDGTITVIANGGTGAYSYSITDPIVAGPSATGNFTGLTGDYVINGGTEYTIQVTDENGCVHETTQVITQPDELIITVDAFTNETCDYNDDGTITVIANGGTGAYSYSITDPIVAGPSATGNFTGLTGDYVINGGTEYTIQVTDENGCVHETTQVITQPDELIITVDAFTNETCDYNDDGTITVIANGGTGAYSYSITDPIVAGPSATGNFTGLTGDYVINGGTEYTIQVTDENGCVHETTQVITQPDELIITVDAFTNETCDYNDDGTITVIANGGTGAYSYSITDPIVAGPSATGNFTGLTGDYVINGGTEYTIQVTDENGCVHETTQVITQPDELIITVDAFTNETCDYNDDGTITVIANGGTGAYSYSITDPIVAGPSATGNFTGLTGDYVINGGTEYTIQVTDENGCVHETTQVITQPDELIITVDAFTNETCDYNDDGTITVIANGGTGAYSYSITDPIVAGPSATGNFTGLTGDYVINGGTEYTIQVTDENGCVHETTQVITQPDELIITVDAFTNETCDYNDDGTITVIANGGTGAYSYSITDPIVAGPSATGNFTGLTGDYVINGGTEYTIQVTDENGCVHETTQLITQPDPLEVITNLTSDYNGFGVSCGDITVGVVDDGIVSATPSGGTAGYTYIWTTTDGAIPNGQELEQNPQGLEAGTYEVSVTDANGCVINSIIEVTEPAVLNFDNVEPSVYAGGFNLSGCDPDGFINVTVADGVAPYSYQWNGPGGIVSNNQNITDLPAGTYSLVVTDANGCEIDTLITLIEPSGLSQTSVVSLYPSGDNISCFGATDGFITVTTEEGTAPYDFDWTGPNGFTSTTESISDLVAGTYTLIITDANGCQIDTTIVLVEPTPLVQDITSPLYPSGDNISCFGAADGSIDYTINGGSPGYTFDWSTGATTEDLADLGPGTYTVTVTDAQWM